MYTANWDQGARVYWELASRTQAGGTLAVLTFQDAITTAGAISEHGHIPSCCDRQPEIVPWLRGHYREWLEGRTESRRPCSVARLLVWGSQTLSKAVEATDEVDMTTSLVVAIARMFLGV